MTHIALLRGVNAGKNRRVDMKQLRALFESLGYTNVSTYINSGNIIFDTKKSKAVVMKEIEACFSKAFPFGIDTLIKTKTEMKKIAHAIPNEWQNDTSSQRTDVAYLFADVDSKKILDDLPMNKEYIDIRYVKGAVLWNMDRKQYNKSKLNDLIKHPLYQRMTIRNVNTARRLAL